jgi:hypothetical protein
MTTISDIKTQLTDLEFQSLTNVLNDYDYRDIICYTNRLTPSEKGVFGSLVKKGMIYDSYAGMGDDGYEEGNWFPSGEVIEAFGLPEYQP